MLLTIVLEDNIYLFLLFNAVGAESELEAVRDAQFLESGGEMGFYGSFGDVEGGGNIGIGFTERGPL